MSYTKNKPGSRKATNYRCVGLACNGKSIVKDDNIVGFCNSAAHKGCLTPSLIKTHGCIAKNCNNLIKYEEKDYWAIRAREEKKKQKAKRDRKQRKVNTRKKEYLESQYHRMANRLVAQWQLPIIVTSVRCVAPSKYTLYYVSDVRKDDYYYYMDFSRRLGQMTSCKFHLIHVRTADGIWMCRRDLTTHKQGSPRL